ncbi:MAG: apolipoprotein N-acyltransferase [Nitrospirota bacterium]|nr:apolipoprotein N-acyltransferase [Nitrospirota bacterium]
MTPVRRFGRPALPLLLSLASGVLLGAAAPGVGPGLFAWFALVPLLLAVNGETSLRRTFLLGWGAGTVAFLVSMGWVVQVMRTFGGLPWLLAAAAALLLAAYLGLYLGAFALGVRLVERRTPVPVALFAPLWWVALEYLRTSLLTGLPWNLLGLSAYGQIRTIQLADFGGIYAVSWFLATINLCLYALVMPFMDRTRGYRQAHFFNHGLAMFLLPVCVAAYGQVRIASLSLHHQQHPDPAGPLRVALVQPNIPQDIKWDPLRLEEIFQRLERQTRSTAEGIAPEKRPQLIVWPEASAPLVLESSPAHLERIRELARATGSHLLVGALSPVFDTNRVASRNSAYLIAPDGASAGMVAKEHLVPFGEYVPLEHWLPFVRRLTQGIGDMLPGSGPAVLPFPGGGAGLAVCYELIFPELVRQRFVHGAAFLVTITNDAWFGTSAAPEQHFANAAFRAVENRTWVLRSANTGISGVVDPYGITQARAGLNSEAVVIASIDRRAPPAPFYSRHGNLFSRSASGLALLTLGAALWRGNRGRAAAVDDL